MSDIIDINVNETVEEVTINVVDNLITVNINNVTGGGGGTQTLAQTLVLGNNTGGENISISNGDAIILDNGSMLKKGTIDAGNGGAKGIAQICSVGYEHKWEAGRLYIMNDGGLTIREVSHNFTVTPTATDDVTKGFVENTRWILDNGDVYLCTDPTTDAAVWELVNTGITPTLQQVTTEGNETSNPIKVIDTSNTSAQLQANGIVFEDLDDLGNTILRFDQTSVANQEVLIRGLSGTMALLSDIPDTSTLVPYTGADDDVNLGEFGLLTGNIEFDNTPTNIPTAAGSVYYNDTDGTLDLILKGGNVKLQIGQEQVVRVVNKTATNVNLLEANYQAVRVTGAQGQRLKVDLAQSTTDGLSAETIGLVTETINNNQEGFITTSGLVRNINTTGSLQSETWADGDILYLSPTTAGNVTKVKPTAPNHLVIIGYVISAHATQGSIFVKVDNGYELDELHNVKITTATNSQALTYTSATDIWENKTIIQDSITNGVTTIAPSQNAVFDALALKQAALSYTPYKNLQTSQTGFTGTVAETILFTATIPANAFSSNDIIKVLIGANKTTNLGSYTLRLRVNTTNTISGAPTIATYISSASIQSNVVMRNYHLNGGNLLGHSFSTTAITDIFASPGLSSTPLNPANQFFIFATITLSNSLDTIIGNMLSIHN